MVGQEEYVIIRFRVAGIAWVRGIDVTGYLKKGSKGVFETWGKIGREKFPIGIEHKREC